MVKINSILSLNSNNIKDVADPVDEQDVATKNYVDNNSGGSTISGLVANNMVYASGSTSISTTDQMYLEVSGKINIYNLAVLHGFQMSSIIYTSGIAMTIPYGFVGVDSSQNGEFTLILPYVGNFAQPPAGISMIIKDIGGQAATYNITIMSGTDGGSIEGLSPIKLNANYGAVTIISDGEKWWITNLYNGVNIWPDY